jgi:hypothetical protein
MIVAVRTMGMVEVPTHQIINVVAMRRAFMPAVGAVNMFAIVPFTLMAGRAAVRVRAAYRNGVFVDVIGMDVVQVTVMKIVGMPVVAYRHVAAIRTMHVIVGCVR